MYMCLGYQWCLCIYGFRLDFGTVSTMCVFVSIYYHHKPNEAIHVKHKIKRRNDIAANQML